MRIPRHSTVIAYLALFSALGGTGYAAVSIGSREVRDNSLTGRDIRNASVQRGDLARNARPHTPAQFAQAVENTMTSEEVLSALSGAVEGDPGPQGAAGTPGAQGAQGPQGAAGSPGQALAYGRVRSDGALSASLNIDSVTVAQTAGGSFGGYCIDAAVAVRNLTLTPDASDGGVSNAPMLFVIAPGSSGNLCGDHFHVMPVRNGAFEPQAFYFTLN